MTSEKLIKILGAVDPESEVVLQLGHVDEDDYRDVCAKVQIADGDCLDFLEIDEVFINEDGDRRLSPNLILRQFNYNDIDGTAADFDKEYTKVRNSPTPPDTQNPHGATTASASTPTSFTGSSLANGSAWSARR